MVGLKYTGFWMRLIVWIPSIWVLYLGMGGKLHQLLLDDLLDFSAFSTHHLGIILDHQYGLGIKP